MTTTYTSTSQIANDPAGILWLEKKEGQTGKTTLADIKDALDEYKTNFNAGNVSKAEILTLYRAFPDSPTYKQAAVGIQKMDMVDPLVIGGPASVEMIDREGHLITTNALSKAFQKFMDNQRTRNVMVLHSDVQVGWALPAYITKGGQIFKSGVGDNGLFFICELRDDTAIAKKVADQINQGTLKSYSIAGSATKIQNMKKGETPYMQVDEMELAEVTICEKGVNQGANFELLKAELPQTGKIDKDQCGYRDATAPEEKMGINCGHCKYFNSDTRTCDVVVGDIMPGDYCRLFEQEEKPKAIVHRKIIIMHKDNTGRINFKDSFMGWMEKEKAGEDPLKSGKSFATLNNIAGREAEHHRLLEEYGFPSEPDLDTMRYIPVVETETDDDGKPINIIPPWVVNEAGQDLGDKLDNDVVTSVNKSMDIINDILQKARTGNRTQAQIQAAQRRGGPKRFQQRPGQRKHKIGVGWKESQSSIDRTKDSDVAAEERATPIGDPTQIKKPTTPQSDDPSANTPNPRKVMDKANGDPPQPPRINPQTYVPPSGQAPSESGPNTGSSTQSGPGILDRMQRQFGAAAGGLGQAAGAAKGVAGQVAGQGREAIGRGAELGRQAAAGGRQVMDRSRDRLGAGAKRMGELFRTGKERAGELGRAVGQDAAAVRGRIAEGGREVGRKSKAGAQEARRRVGEAGKEVKRQGQEVAAGWRGDEYEGQHRQYRMVEGGDGRMRRVEIPIKGGRAYKLGRLGRSGAEGAKAGTKEAYRRGAEGTREFGGGLREGFGSYDRDTQTFDRDRSGGGTGQRRGDHGTVQRSGARRMGQLFGATGRGAAASAEEGGRKAGLEAGRFGRGVARGARPGRAGEQARDLERYGPGAVRDEQGNILGARGTKRSASEKFGQWLGERGRERGADVLDTTGQTARGFARGIAPGERGKRLRAEEAASGKDRTWGEKIGQVVGTSTRGAGRQGGNVATQAGRDIPRFGSKDREKAHMMNNEGVGRGVNFQPNAHRGASLKEQHQMVTGLTDKVNSGDDMSPKEWMQLIHHMSQTPDGQQYASFSDIDISHGDWNKPMKFSDMRQHLERMNVGHGTHGDVGKRGFDKLINKIENVSSGQGGSLKLKPLTEGEGPDTNYNDSDDRQGEQRERQTDDREGGGDSGSPDEQRARERENRRRELEADKQRRRQDKEDKPASEGWGPNPMDMDWDTEKAPVHKTFAKAFGITKTRR